MPKGQTTFPGAEFWLLKCPCMKGDSKKFKDKKAYDLYRKLHNKKCDIGRNGTYVFGGDPSNNLLITPTMGDKAIRSNYLTSIHKSLYD